MVLDSGNSEFMGPENWVLGLLPASLPKPFFEPPSPHLHRPINCNQLSFIFFFKQSTQMRGLMVPAPVPLGARYPNPVAQTQWTRRGGSHRFSQRRLGLLSIAFLVLASAWPLRVQCTQNYNVITQAGAHSEDSHLGRCTPGAGRDKGHSEAEVTCICIFSRGGLKYNFSEDCIMDYCLRKLC